jgi:UDP-N-acetylglucosamine pyrophosphorylase
MRWLPLEEKREIKEIGLKTISEGKLGVVINAAGIANGDQIRGPKILSKPPWALNMTVLECYLQKLKNLSQFAIEKYGKNFVGKREAILVLLIANENEIDEVDEFLIANKYFQYPGVIVLTECVMPDIDFKGRIIKKSEDQISFSSSGSGGFLANLKKADIFESWEKSGTEYLNIVNLSNLNIQLCDPLSLGFMLNKGFQVVADCFHRNKDSIEHPCFLEDQKGKIDLYYPYNVKKTVMSENPDVAYFESLHLNMFITVAQLSKLFSKQSAELFEYQIKEKNLGRELIKKHTEKLSLSSSVDWLPRTFTFELNAVKLMSLSDKVCLLEREKDEYVAFKSVGLKKFDMKRACDQLMEKAVSYVKNELKMDPGNFIADFRTL